MKAEKKTRNKVVAWDEHLDKKYGKRGSVTKTEF